MQLNGTLFKGFRGIKAIWGAICLAIVGGFFIGLGIYFMFNDVNKDYIPTTATVKEVKYDLIGEDKEYYVIIDYTDKDGNTHTNVKFNGYTSGWEKGTVINIKYNPNNFNEVCSDTPAFVLPLISIVMGSIAVAVGVFTSIAAIRSLRRKPRENVDITSEEFTANGEQVDMVKDTDYYFHYCGKLNQSHKVEDREGNVVYECKLAKFSLLGASTYDFINHRNGSTKRYKIGKTSTLSSDDIMTNSSFSIDGINCWDYLAKKGYDIKQYLDVKTIASHNLVKDGMIVASVVLANNKHPFDKENVNYLHMGNGYYRLEINNANLPDVVMAAFILSRVEIAE